MTYSNSVYVHFVSSQNCYMTLQFVKNFNVKTQKKKTMSPKLDHGINVKTVKIASLGFDINALSSSLTT